VVADDGEGDLVDGRAGRRQAGGPTVRAGEQQPRRRRESDAQLGLGRKRLGLRRRLVDLDGGALAGVDDDVFAARADGDAALAGGDDGRAVFGDIDLEHGVADGGDGSRRRDADIGRAAGRVEDGVPR
jgi:hypothetical protein